MNVNDTEKFAAAIRSEAVKMVAAAKASHIGGALSMADLLAVLYGGILKVDCTRPQWPERDRLILSKGHCCTSLYAALALRGFFDVAELATYGKDDSRLMSHISHKVPGVEFSTGSLGHGLPFGCGRALAAKRKGAAWRTFVILGDGEMDEGSNWEALLFAAQHKLDNLMAIIDRNGIQSLGTTQEVMNLEPLAEKIRAFGWEVREIDGHDHASIREATSAFPSPAGKPVCVIARTVKGKGVSFMENQLLWHYRSPDSAQLGQALEEINRQGTHP